MKFKEVALFREFTNQFGVRDARTL